MSDEEDRCCRYSDALYKIAYIQLFSTPQEIAIYQVQLRNTIKTENSSINITYKL